MTVVRVWYDVSQRAACGTFLKRDLHHVGDFNANASANAQYLKSMVDKDATAPDMQSSFYVLRTILKSASYMSNTVEAVKKALPALKFVDPYTMGLLVKCESGAIDCTLKK